MFKFFDRDAAYADIKEVLKQVKLGKSSAVWIEGCSGVGKTRFMEYVSSQENELKFFTFLADDIFYKCERGSVGSSFEYIAAIIFELQREDPKHFELYIQDYFDSLEHISFLDACCLIIPQIKSLNSVSKLIETKYKNITDMQSKISDRLVTYQLVDLFSDLILTFLRNIYKSDTIIFGIDDAQWLDNASLRVFETLIKKSRKDEKGPAISLILSSREKAELSEEETQNYQNIYRILTTIFQNMKTIYLENFDLPTTREVIQDTNRYYLVQQIPLLYKMTGGNPLELDQTLRFSDERIRMILQRETRSGLDVNRDNTFTVERVASIYYKSPINTVILSVLSILRRHISIRFLFTCTMDIYYSLLCDICSYPDFANALASLEEKEFVECNQDKNEVSLKHDSIYHTVLDYLSQNGDYVLYGRRIATLLLCSDCEGFLKAESQKLLALRLLKEVEPSECFKQFQKIYRCVGAQIEPEFFALGADAFCAVFLGKGLRMLDLLLPLFCQDWCPLQT